MNVTSSLKSASLLAILLIPTFCYADAYKPSFISDVSTVQYDDGSIKLKDRDIQYTISYQSVGSKAKSNLYEAYSPDHIKYVVEDSWNLLGQFLTLYKIPKEDCRDNYNIHLFVVDNSVLFESHRFKHHFKRTNSPETILYGYYDSTSDIEKNSVILITDIKSDTNSSTLAHEMSHYWWDRMCLANYWKGNTENFADLYEEFYEEQR